MAAKYREQRSKKEGERWKESFHAIDRTASEL